MTARPALCLTGLLLALSSRVDLAHAQAKPAPATKPASPSKAAPSKVAPPKPEAAPAPEGPPPLAESLTGEAKADYEAARLLYGNGDHAGALVKFLAAYDKAKDPRLLWNVAACENKLRHYSSLRTYLRRYLAEGATVLSVAEKADAEALLQAIEPLTAMLDLSVSESGARVFVDDAPVGETPLPGPIMVDVGPRKIRIEKEGFDVYREELTIGDSPRLKLVAKLDKVVNDATLIVYTARPKDEIFLDGTLRGLGTWKGTVPSGGHTLRVAAPEMRPYQTDVFLHDRETRTVAITLERDHEVKPSAPIPKWMWIGGAALVITGAVVAGWFVFKPDDKPADTPVGTLDPGSVQASFPGGLLLGR